MSTYTLLSLCLTFHLAGLTLMAGTIIVDRLLYRAFWRQLSINRQPAVYLLATMASIRRITKIGAGLLIVTGIGMMAVTDGVFGEQVWFRVKFGLVLVLLALNWLAHRWGQTLRTLVTNAEIDSPTAISRMKRSLDRYFPAAFLILFFIILLSVFKFN